MEGNNALNPQRLARLAGLLYLITIVSGLFAELGVRGRLVVPDDAATTAANILSHEELYRLGTVADLVMISCYVAVTLLFYQLFRPVHRIVALVAAAFSMLGIATLASASAATLAPIVLLAGDAYLGVFDSAQRQALALVSLKLHARAYCIADIFFGLYCSGIGGLILVSRFLPPLLGALMAMGGLAYIVDNVTFLLTPAVSAGLPDLSALAGVAELVLTLWLLVRGVDAARWNERFFSSIGKK